MTDFELKKFPIINFFLILSYRNKFVINLGLDPDPDWVWNKQQTGSGSGFIKIPGSGSSP
jgi:hypothetical protein